MFSSPSTFPRNASISRDNCSAAVLTAEAGTIFRGNLSSAQEVPTNASTATGVGNLQLNDAGTQITVQLTFSGLSSNQSAAHIHGNAPHGQNAPVLFTIPITGTTSGGSAVLTFNVTAAQVVQLRGGKWYFNVLTATNPGGEIRGQILPQRFVDFDGDGKTDIGITRRPGVIGPWTWWFQESSTGTIKTFNFGESPRDLVQPLDFDGDGKNDIALWRNSPATGQVSAYYIIRSSDSTIQITPFGQNGDVPTSEDYDGDGKADLSVWRAPTTGQGAGQAVWYYRGSLNNPNGNITYIPWGMRYGTQADQVDDPYPGDFDADGKADFRVQRRSDIANPSATQPGIFHTLTATGNISYDYFGISSDRILPGDYDGDGRTDIAVARGFNVSPGNTTWFIRYSSGIPDSSTVFGAGFNFAQGDYDGDGKCDIGYFIVGSTTDETGFWYITSTTGQTKFVRWGARGVGAGAGDLPIAGYNNR